MRPSGLRLLVGVVLAGIPVAPLLAEDPATSTPRVLTSFLPIHSLTLAVAGTRARVENWLPAGVDPHDFQFAPRDLRRLHDADLLIVGGLGLEGWSETRLRTLADQPRLRLVETAAGIPADQLIHDSDPHGHETSAGPAAPAGKRPNPHFWLDPLLAAHAVSNILQALQSADPDEAEVYARNAAGILGRLQDLHRDFERELKDCAATPFLTYHGAFPYLVRRYHLRLVGVVEIEAERNPSARELAVLSQRARQEGVRVLFVDGPPTSLARRLAEDLKLEIASLRTLETGEFGPDAYEQGMRRNLEVLRTALRPSPKP